MVTATLALSWRLLLFLGAGFAAGVSNGIAGGGTFITFPTMLAVGIPALTANVSSSVGVLPSYLGGIRGFRHQIATHKALLLRLMPSCFAGAATGCTLLFVGSPGTFRAIVPWLIAGGTLLFACSPLITKRLAHLDHAHPSRTWALYGGVFLVSVYGGYFGAGLGILLLALMALALPLDIHELQGIRSVLSTVINAVAAVIFLLRGHLAWDAVPMLFVGTLVGGWLGTILIKRLSPTVVRTLVVATGVVTTIRLLTTG